MAKTTGKTTNKKPYPQTVAEILAITDQPVVAIDQAGLFTFVNNAFKRAYGWKNKDLIDMPVTQIMPPHLRDGHKVGFARYLATEQATLLGKPLPLGILHKDGSVGAAEHFILGEKVDGDWRFAAIIKTRD